MTEQVYIGATLMSLEDRKKDHLQRVDKTYGSLFHQAIGTFGEEVFIWEEVDTATSIEEMAKKEKCYILKFNTKEKGYNADSGGGFKKNVYKYDLECKILVDTYECLKDAGISVGASKKDISRACLSVNKIYKGFYWSYEKYEVYEPLPDKRKKEVSQFDLNGDLLATFKSISEASKATGVNKSSIAKVCREERKSAGEFYFKFC